MTIAHKQAKKRISIFIIVILILAPIAFSLLPALLGLLAAADFAGEFFKEKEPRLPWHAVEDWEVDVCTKWGGRTQAEQGETAPITAYGEMTATLQARKTKTLDETLYEATYFIETYSTTTNYDVKLVNKKTGATHKITTGNLEPGSGTTDYWAQYLLEDYTDIELTYAKGHLSAPIVKM